MGYRFIRLWHRGSLVQTPSLTPKSLNEYAGSTGAGVFGQSPNGGQKKISEDSVGGFSLRHCGYRCGLQAVGALPVNIVLTTSGRARSPCNLHRFQSEKGIHSRSGALEALPVLILRLIVTAGKLVGMVYAF